MPIEPTRRTTLRLAAALPFSLAASCRHTTHEPDRHPLASAGPPPSASSDEVRVEFLHAWEGYKRFAYGWDDLSPLSRTGRNWYAKSLLMSPVDALDTMLIMGLTAQAQETIKLIVERLNFDHDFAVKTFEVNIRLLGGLLSAFELTGERRLLALADDLGQRLLPAFRSPTNMPYRYVHLRTGATRDPKSNPAEIGTLLLEFGTLSAHTGKPVYFDTAKLALTALWDHRSKLDLVGEVINVETGQWEVTDSHIGKRIDSYYEYLLKGALLFNDRDCERMWKRSLEAIQRHLADEVQGALWYGHADMNTGERAARRYGALEAFFPAVLALGGAIAEAQRLQESSLAMWQAYGVEPEEYDYVTQKPSGSYHLRPEIIESAYYLFHYTKDPVYVRQGQQFFAAFRRDCRTDVGYASIVDVKTKVKLDQMESYVFAETFKYFYLLLQDKPSLDFSKVIFNSEAHPFRFAS